MVPDKAERVTITDVDGKDYLDFTSGWSIVNTGYSHPKVVKAVKEQIDRLSYASLTTFTHEPAVLLAERLIELTPGSFPKKVWFGLSGSDAGDCVYKLLPAYTGRHRLISFQGSVHGMTMGGLFLTGHRYAAKFEGSPRVTKVPYPYCYRCPFHQQHPDCGLACLDFLEKQVFATSSPPEETAALVVESVQSDAGDVFPPQGYLPALKELCQKNGIQFVASEVLVGYGRTGSLFAIEHDSVVPDVIILGKPMASGMPLSAVVSRAEILERTGAHLVTTGGNPVSCAAGLATLDVIAEERLADNAVRVGDYMKKRLLEIAERHSLIGDVRGRGLILGTELVRDRKSKEPASKETAKLCYRAWELGLLLHYVGIHSNVVEITPPLILNTEEAEMGLQIYEKALTDVEAGRVLDEKVAPFAGW
jgi:4-aminobutyrate aminotransferase